MRVNTRVELDHINNILRRRGLEARGRAQKILDSEVLRLSEPYTPFHVGGLKGSGIRGTTLGSGKVIWNAPYARFLYYGKVMVGIESGSPWAKKGERKVKTNKNLTYNDAPKRGSFWFERMKTDHLKDLLNKLAQVVGGRVR